MNNEVSPKREGTPLIRETWCGFERLHLDQNDDLPAER